MLPPVLALPARPLLASPASPHRAPWPSQICPSTERPTNAALKSTKHGKIKVLSHYPAFLCQTTGMLPTTSARHRSAESQLVTRRWLSSFSPAAKWH